MKAWTVFYSERLADWHSKGVDSVRFLYYWPLALLILIPVIIVMYLLKQKAVDHPFSSLFLWKELYKNMQANTPWEKLKKNLLMYLQIATVLALILALMSPYIKSDTTSAGHVVLVIDTSGSMNTMYDDSHTRIEAAVSEALAYVERLPADTAVSVITSDKEAMLVITDSIDKSLIKRRIKEIRATNYAGDCNAGREMAESMLAQWDNSQVVFFTDSFVSLKSTGGHIVDVYSERDNALIEYVGHGTDSDGFLTVLTKVTNYSEKELKTDINLYGDGEMIAVQELIIPAGESKIAYFEKLTFKGSVIYAELNDVNDALSRDNGCYDIITDKEECKVLLMTDRNLYLEKAISLIDGVTVTKSNDIASIKEFEREGYDLYIFDGMTPKELPAAGSVLLINCDGCDGLFTVAEEKTGIMINAKDSKVTKYLENYSFGAAKVKAMELPAWAESFLAAGYYSAGFIGNYQSRTICVLGFDIHDTELPLKTEFPILIYNIMSECISTGMLSGTVITAGNGVKISGKSDGRMPVVVLPDGKVSQLSGNITNYTDTNGLGVYSVSQQTDDAELKASFAVNFPKSESIIRNTPDSAGTEAGAVVKAAVSTALNLRNIIIIAVLLLLCIEWIVYIKG